jgi:hypothetical protein
MWEKKIKKTIFTLAVDNWQPEIDFYVINKRKNPKWPITYEKFQIYQLAQEMGNDWNIYIDADALIHPEMPDFTQYLSKDTVAHVGCDHASIRWLYDRYFLRDGRNIGSCNWFSMASDWCIDLWHPVDDLTPQETIDRCFPTVAEELSGVISSYHLIDDFIAGRNIAKFGLKFKKLEEIINEKYPGSWFFWHQYTVPPEQKVIEMRNTLKLWGLL